jgi:hypothetical protein
MLARKDGQAYHGVLVDAEPASGLTKATTLLQMLEYRQGFVLGEFGVVERRTFAFGEALLAGSAGQDTALFVGAVAKAHPSAEPIAPPPFSQFHFFYISLSSSDLDRRINLRESQLRQTQTAR